jgi:DNA-binding NarL/FixJ family response regulator
MSLTVLIVDDHRAVRLSLRSWLEMAFPQCRFVEAASGEEAVTMAQSVNPALVIMDVGLPGINGIEATRQIKASRPDVLVVMLSVYDDEAYRFQAADAGASAYVSKWRMQAELQPVVAQLLSL